MKKLILFLSILFLSSTVYAEWKYNNFTGKLDYYELGGNFGSFSSTIPQGILYISSGNTAASSPLIVTNGNQLTIGAGTTQTQAALFIRGSGTGTGFALRIADTTPTDRLVVQDDGNVGLGMTAPTSTLHIVSTGSLAIPQGTAPTVDAAGEIAHDTTDDQFLYGATPRVLVYTYEKCFSLETAAVADDNIPISSFNDAITITSMYCRTQGGTSAELQISDGTNACESIVCDSDGQADDGTLINNTFTANERMEFDTIAVTGSVTWVNYCIRYTVDRQ